MNELIVKTTLPELAGNFDKVKAQLVEAMKSYDVIITEETVKDGKTMASELNKIKKTIKDAEKRALEEVLKPVDGFKEKIKELLIIADEARDKITAQVAAYEDKTKLEIQGKIKTFLSEEVAKAELREPFIKIEVLDLVKLTAQTKTGNLTTVTMTAIKGRVSEQKNLQLEEDTRIAQEAQEKADEIEKIKEDARIEAEANIKVHVTVEPPIQEQPMTPAYNEHPQSYQEPIPEPTYQEEFNPETGEVYSEEVPAFMEEPIQLEVKSGTVIITAEFEVDISEIPNITNEQLTSAIQNRLKAADVNNSTIVAIQRF